MSDYLDWEYQKKMEIIDLEVKLHRARRDLEWKMFKKVPDNQSLEEFQKLIDEGDAKIKNKIMDLLRKSFGG